MEQKPGGRPSPAIYVPRGRRELNEKKELEEKLKREEETKRPASDMEISSDHSSPARKALRTNNRWILDEADSVSKEPASSSSRYYQPYQPPKIDDSEFLTLIDDDKLASSCLIITGIPIDMSDAGKSRVVEQYQQAGGVLRWIGNVAIVAFTNESIASRALKSNNKSMYRAELLVGQSAEYLAGENCFIIITFNT